MIEESFEAKGKRKRLIEELRGKGITDERVLIAMGKVPRHLFMDDAFLKHAYQDKAFPISAGQTISQPYTVAVQTILLNVGKRDKVLEIGTGSGYQAAILAEMGVRVYTIERQRELYRKAQVMLGDLGYRVHFFLGDGYEGQPQYGPYDGIVITAATADVPDKLLKQLRIGGRLVVPRGDRDSQVMTVYERLGEEDYEITTHGYFVFVPMLRGIANGNNKD
ncbi:MAG: protein-L-isoaspartate(D-aspartate) O-methyltransferase [Bacteroidales bacterium]|jgi:protein-L-isoaspartate(D-aspartate) O-methyltransferase|nr:protein-L-isoaspartate(D-aspartate) O-methyltransferase [Bacteroidales bacterium]MCB9028242.1 protein-L-isoaspartate(D-aspartate) O-methyltransferase [Bacteroidales bacterium]MDD3736089.1 protein-L-isoaspartate(D-aspartate) O-methyltransferase [Bacteroidales bacterium]HNT93811.1 protein-L-isoaspartate(D-aspartate) O-methyltransferase [Bacteroidales bacterium]HOO66927.1 protein-L-isoaspartate(D-aspartate) O-methyltransferase [Bacteroidales bacterium]